MTGTQQGPDFPGGNVSSYRGQVVYLYAYDIAYDLKDQDIQTLLGQKLTRFAVGPSKRNPREALFYRPLMITLPPVQKVGPNGPVRVERTVKLFPVGAISISVSVPFEVRDGQELVAYHELQFADGPLQDQAKQLAEEVRRELAPYCVRPVSQLRDEEAYTVFCIRSPLTADDGRSVPAEAWLRDRQRQVAGLLTQEPNPGILSTQEAVESIGMYLSYYESDLVVIDWDAALVIDQAFDEVLHVMELANVQLAELEAYDAILDDSLVRSYRDLATRTSGVKADVLGSLRIIRLDLARLSDELFNTTKFFGDWHLARVYQHLSARFHLRDWQKTVEDKLKTLDGLYQILKQDQLNRWMMALEITIVLLFIIDLVVLLIPVVGK
ncbi:MAG: hypothetical protein ACE15C_09420 [Phycisphaerae bacterium]